MRGNSKKPHGEQGNQQICLQLLKTIKIDLFDVHRKNMRYGHLHFMLMVCVSVSIKMYENSLAITHFFMHLTTIIMKKSVYDVPLGGLRLKTARNQQTRS